MNKIKIFCFFLVIEIFSSLLLDQNFRSTTDDIRTCENKSKDKCTSSQFGDKSLQCCRLKSDDTDYCGAMVNPLKSAKEELETENGKKMTKEYMGFNIFSNNETHFPSDILYNCSDGDLNIKVDLNSYSEEEKAKFKKDNHCLNYMMPGKGKSFNKETCYNSTLATTGNSGVTCGYYEYTLKFNDSTSYNFSSCFLFNEDIIKTNNLGYYTKYVSIIVANRMISEKGKELSSYQFTATDSKGNSFNYDSAKKPDDVNSAKFLGINLLLIILCLI